MSLVLTDEEAAALKKVLLDFIHRAASKNNYDSNEELRALPRVLKWLYHLTRE